MRRSTLVLLLILSSWLSAHGQSTAEILRKSSLKAKSLQNISYKVKTIGVNPFSAGDTTHSEDRFICVFNSNGNLQLQDHLMDIGKIGAHEILKNDTLYIAELPDSVYTIEAHPKKVYNILASITDNIDNALNKYPKRISKQADTSIDGAHCFSFIIKNYDTVENGNHDYTYDYFYIDKHSLMPVYCKNIGAGNAEKGGHSLGRLHFYSETRIYDYQFNKTYSQEVFSFNKTGFYEKNKEMLSVGTIAPPISILGLSKEIIPASSFNNKVLLVEFGATACSANPLANPMLNRLNQKYASSNVAVVSIYSDETADQVKKYIDANHLLFPVYMSDKKLKHKFKTLGTPNFYIIDKQGRIAAAFDGYSDELEAQVISAIDKAL